MILIVKWSSIRVVLMTDFAVYHFSQNNLGAVIIQFQNCPQTKGISGVGNKALKPSKQETWYLKEKMHT